MEALLTLLAEPVGVLGLVSLHLGCAPSIVAVLSNPGRFVIVALVLVTRVLEVGIAGKIVQFLLMVLLFIVNDCSFVMICACMMVVNVRVKQCDLIVIRL